MTEANVYCQDLRGPFSVELSRAALVAMILGVCFHLAIRDVEVDYRLWRMTAIWTTLATMFVFTLIRLCDFTILQALGRLFVVSWSFNIGLALSMGIYRVFLHRLRNFPGPFGAKLSRLYAVKASSNLQYNRELENMHEKYGDVVRTGNTKSHLIRFTNRDLA